MLDSTAASILSQKRLYMQKTKNSDYFKFLKKHGALPEQIKATLKTKSKKLVSENEGYSRPAGNIAPNGTKPVDDFGHFKSNTHVVAPVCNKGAYQVVSVTDVKTMGRKV